MLLDRYFLKNGIQYKDITPLDRLSYIGDFGIGALQFIPFCDDVKPYEEIIVLDDIAKDSLLILNECDESQIEKLLLLGGRWDKVNVI